MLARRWPRWLAAMPVAFVLLIVFVVSLPAMSRTAPPIMLGLIGGSAFALSCAASCFGFLALFARFARRRVRVFDSLRDNAYGMYLIHYIFVIWLQYALLSAPLPAIAKRSIVFLGVLALSWGTTAAIRRIPAVGRVV